MTESVNIFEMENTPSLQNNTRLVVKSKCQIYILKLLNHLSLKYNQPDLIFCLDPVVS